MAGYRYYRTTFTSVVGGNGLNFLTEIYAYAGVNATGSELRMSATASGTVSSPSGANDGSAAGILGGSSGATLIYDFGSPTVIQSMKYETLNDPGNYAARTYAGNVAGSNDNSNYTTLASFTGQNPGTAGGNFIVSWTIPFAMLLIRRPPRFFKRKF